MRVLAIDPGYDRCGIAVMEKRAGKEVLLFSECIVTSRTDIMAERLNTIGARCKKIIEYHAPTALAIEKLYFSKNEKTALAVAEARGMLLFLGAAHGLSVSEYTPNQVKLAVTGSGVATKDQIVRMIPRLVIMTTTPQLDDEWDAIAIGITHLAHAR